MAEPDSNGEYELHNNQLTPNKSIKENARPCQHELVIRRYAANVSHAWDGFAIVSQAFINQMVRVRMAGPLICERWVNMLKFDKARKSTSDAIKSLSALIIEDRFKGCVIIATGFFLTCLMRHSQSICRNNYRIFTLIFKSVQ